jgi:hypothetical protein
LEETLHHLARKNVGHSIGSGPVELAVKLVHNQRIKRQGMRWQWANADLALAFCVRRLNDD